MTTPLPPSIKLSPSTRTLFSANRSSIVWDSQTLRIIRLDEDSASLSAKLAQEIHWDGAEIADVAIFGDDLAILTRCAVGTEWKPPWQRRYDRLEDPWGYPRPLYSYTIALFSIELQLQTGESVLIPHHGVGALIRTGFHRVIVQIAGPKSISSFWEMPTADFPTWKLLHEELTWDPEVIAREIGFVNAEAELSATVFPKGIRHEQRDREILDYVFLSSDIVLRLLEDAVDRAGADFSVQAFDLQTSSGGPKGPTAAPSIFTLVVACSDIYIEKAEGLFTTSNTETHTPDFVIISLHCADNPCARIILRTSTLMGFVRDPETLPSPGGSSDGEILYEEWRALQFMDHIRSWRDRASSLGPTIHNNVVFLPITDVDPESTDLQPLLRFMNVATESYGATNLDIPLATLLPNIPVQDLTPYIGQLWPPTIAVWDGFATLCVILRGDHCEEDSIITGWYVKVDTSILEKIGVPT
ncbi:hypothetical protein B0H10DRAFT_2046387 [Mycena sp. CBHHK59/15]|nr:hypothetical protein B0H10DRAFT_2046387 [Mycena sp. CBHHK59/15]